MTPIRKPPTTDETIKETFESIVIAFILAFIFRAYVVEAFIIPTGSMAPTLLGQHFEVTCQQCGYDFSIDQSGQPQTEHLRPDDTPCPMCRFPQPVPTGLPTQSGDRLLVQKYMYYIAEPSRWDVVVFRNPQRTNADGSPGPKTNYIKRLVGLPNEALYLIDGNVYVRPFDQPDGAWRIARKTDPAENRHWEKIQRSVWQPIYHSRYVPLDHGKPAPPSDQATLNPPTGRRHAWVCPWKPAKPDDARWERGDAEQGWKRSYAFTPDPALDEAGAYETHQVGELTFDWIDYHGRGTAYPYNYTVINQGVVGRQPIEDIRLATTVVPTSSEVSIELQTTARLESEVETITARYWPNGTVDLLRKTSSQERVMASVRTPTRLTPGKAVELELWAVDQELLVWADGELLIRQSFDLPMTLLEQRAAPLDRPEVAIRVVGGGATLHAVQLDRDLSYTPSLSSSLEVAQYGVLRRAATGVLIHTPPLGIKPDRYFVLGDNSPISSDGRFWNEIEPWVEQNMFDGEASLDSTKTAYNGTQANDTHVVPRGLMVGRAFFIYFPAPYAISRGGEQVLPNFGDMRFVH